MLRNVRLIRDKLAILAILFVFVFCVGGGVQVSYNRIARFMLKMQDSAGIYVTGRQPGSSIFRNYISEQGLTGLEPPPHCDAPGAGRYFFILFYFNRS